MFTLNPHDNFDGQTKVSLIFWYVNPNFRWHSIPIFEIILNSNWLAKLQRIWRLNPVQSLVLTSFQDCEQHLHEAQSIFRDVQHWRGEARDRETWWCGPWMTLDPGMWVGRISVVGYSELYRYTWCMPKNMWVIHHLLIWMQPSRNMS